MTRYHTVVVGTDGHDRSFRAVSRAAEIACESDATLMIACAYRPERDGYDSRSAQGALGQDEAFQIVGSAPAEDVVSRARDHAKAAGATKIETVVLRGRPAHSLEKVVKDRDADLVVVGNHGLSSRSGRISSRSGRILGTLQWDLARHTGADLLVVHTS